MERDIFGRREPVGIQLLPLAGREVFPSEIKQPSADYVKSLSKQFHEIGLQLEEQRQTEAITPECAYMIGKFGALEEILPTLTGKKEPIIVTGGLHERIGIYNHGQPKPLGEESVIILLKTYEYHYKGYLIMHRLLEEGRKHNENKRFYYKSCSGACSVLRDLLINIGQDVPVKKIQTELVEKILPFPEI